MMRTYLKESLHWLHLLLFKPITLKSDSIRLTTQQARRVWARALPIELAIALVTVSLIGIVYQFAGHPFKWFPALIIPLALALAGGILLGFARNTNLTFEFAFLLIAYSGGSVGMGAGLGIGMGVVLATALGIAVGLPLVIELVPADGAALGVGLGIELVCGLVGGVVIVVIDGPREAFYFGLVYIGAFLVGYLRILYVVPYAIQLWRSRSAADPFPFFRNSPVYWDEAIAMPLPFLREWLVRLVSLDRERGMNEIANVARLPYQRRAAQRALVKIVVHELEQADSIEKMASASEFLDILPDFTEALLKGLDIAERRINVVSYLAREYSTRVTPVGQIGILEELRSVVDNFRKVMVHFEPPVGPAFQSAASRWLDIVKAEEVECRKRIAILPIPNPFVVGNPLMVRDQYLFKGRQDIIVAIEENIINPAQRPALLLYGRRRIGKTSTLLNLPRLISSKFVPVFIDCQDAKWREGDEAFCYHLAASIHAALEKGALDGSSRTRQLTEFARYPFTRLGEYLDEIEDSSRRSYWQLLLTFDEYEKLEEGISARKITTEVLNQLRTIVQHRERIVVLFSGSHRFEEMRTINWSDYLINAKMLELSFLAPQDARELITQPVPVLQYEPGVVERILDITHCQPYLLQAVASDLVNYLNSERRMLASAADLEVVVEKVLVTAQAYFFYTWTEDCLEPEREVLRMIAIGDTNNRTLAEYQPSLQSLCHKEILERHASGYRFSIELFRRWVLKNQTTEPFTPGELPEPAELEYAAS